MVHFQDQLADLGLEFLVVGLQLTFSLRRFLDKAVAQILLTPPFDQASGDLIVSCCLRRAQLPGLDLFDQLAFEGGLEPTIVSFSHFSISQLPDRQDPTPGAKGCGKCRIGGNPQKTRIPTRCLEKPRTKQLGFPTLTTAPTTAITPNPAPCGR